MDIDFAAALSFLIAVSAFVILGISLSVATMDRRAKAHCASRRSARHRAREHVAGTLHVRCGRPHPAVQQELHVETGRTMPLQGRR